MSLARDPLMRLGSCFSKGIDLGGGIGALMRWFRSLRGAGNNVTVTAYPPIRSSVLERRLA